MTPATLTLLNVTSVTTARGQQPSMSKNQPQLNKQNKETQPKLIYAHTATVLHKFLPRQSLCKTVCYHNSGGSILQRYFSSINLFPNEVMLNINMLGASMVIGI